MMKSILFKTALSLAIASSLIIFDDRKAISFTSTPVTLAESQLYVAPDAAVHNFNQTINLKKGQDKLQLILTYYDGTNTAPSLTLLRISSPTMNYLTEQQFAGKKELSIDASGELTWGGLQLMIQAQGPRGAEFGWRVTTPTPSVISVYPMSAGAGETVTLTGTNFCPDAANNSVTFNGVAGQCIDASPRRLVVRLPEELPTGNVTGKVVVAGLDAGEFALSAEAVPTVTGFGGNIQNQGGGNVYTYPGAPITITGRGFSTNAALTKVTIGPFDCQIQSATADSITVTAPLGFAGQPWGIHQPVKVWVNGNRAQNALYINIYNQLGAGG
jgi:hypothetical protein